MAVFVDIEKKLGSFFLKVKFETGDETLALLGASGCGKSMTLKCIAGIEQPDRGKIIVDGLTLFDSDKKINLPPQERHVGLMFQNYALFPNMTVLQNIQAGARREKNREKREQAVCQMMESFGLTEMADRYPSQLSGGQQQRVALARILVSAPRILLLDEPFSALDSHLRFRLEQEVRDVIRKFGKTVLLVSHDRDEVFRMADSIAIMNAGMVEAFGKKHEVFQAPRTKAGAKLTGCKNISKIEQRSAGKIFASDWNMELRVAHEIGNARYAGIRMHDVIGSPAAAGHAVGQDHAAAASGRSPAGDAASAGKNQFLCHVTEVIENPFSYVIMVKPVGMEHGTAIGWETDKDTWNRMRAEEIMIQLPAESILLLED